MPNHKFQSSSDGIWSSPFGTGPSYPQFLGDHALTVWTFPIIPDCIKTVASLHNLSVKQIEDYFDKEVIEKLGEK